MAFSLHLRHNGSLGANPPGGDLHINTQASNFAWAVFAIMTLSFLGTLGWMASIRRKDLSRHIIVAATVLASMAAYLCMGSDIGWVVASESDGHLTRQVFLVRHIQWIVNAPFVILILLTCTTLRRLPIFLTICFSWLFVVCGLAGALIAGSYKWALYTLGLFGLLLTLCTILGYVILFRLYKENHRALYIGGATYTSIMWILYAICWALSEGSNTITPAGEMIFYGVLDIFSRPVFCLGFLGFLTIRDARAPAPIEVGDAGRDYELEQQQPAPRPQIIPPSLVRNERHVVWQEQGEVRGSHVSVVEGRQRQSVEHVGVPSSDPPEGYEAALLDDAAKARLLTARQTTRRASA